MAKKTKYQNINISEKNKRDLEDIKRELERFHKKGFRIDVAIGHILKIYKIIIKKLKDKDAYEKYLQKL